MESLLHILSELSTLSEKYSIVGPVLGCIGGFAGGYFTKAKREAKIEGKKEGKQEVTEGVLKEKAVKNEAHLKEHDEAIANIGRKLSSFSTSIASLSIHATKLDALEDRVSHIESSVESCQQSKQDLTKPLERLICLKIQELEKRLTEKIEHIRETGKQEKENEFKKLCELLKEEFGITQQICSRNCE